MAKRDYYDVLGVSRSAGEDEIKKAYRKIAFESHPDRNPGDKAAEQKFKEATEAYEVLRDGDKRARYDQFGHAGVGAAGASGFDFSGFDLADALRAFMRDFGDMGGFEELFGRRAGGSQGPRGAARGDDLQVRVRLALEEVAEGVEKKIRVKHLRPCTVCGGKGGEGEITCTRCQGRGQVRHIQQTIFGQFVNIATCPSCNGSGHNLRERCKNCGGDGTVSISDTIAVQVPRGVASGNFIPLRGMGDAGPRGGPAGDLIVWIEEKPHSVFERLGDDLSVEVPISFATAAMGGRVEVPTLNGTASLSVPAGTQSGQVMRLRGHGLPNLHRGRGDLLARVIIWVPSRLGSGERKLLEDMNRAEGFKPPRPGKSSYDPIKDALAG